MSWYYASLLQYYQFGKLQNLTTLLNSTALKSKVVEICKLLNLLGLGKKQLW